ncbi:MAG TPA: hypothetical protein PLK90_04095 [Clostridiales bacterium]|jgi:hypothetical protein|nr:hypothetical protein [Clostridiales bacterium]HQP69562.1 hypothetical protein [Clostridiales bacterium]
MFQKIIDLMKKKETALFDASVFNDPAAIETEWTPVSRGGSNFKTHNLVNKELSRLEFRAGAGMTVFLSVFMFFGIIFASVPTFFILSEGGNESWVAAFPVLFGLFFASIGFIAYRSGAKPIVFDKSTGLFWKSWTEPNLMLNQTYQNYTRLADIRALQIILEHVRGNKSSYTSYELNLVMKDRSRINVVDHGNIDQLRKDAGVLAEFLNVRVWDATLY